MLRLIIQCIFISSIILVNGCSSNQCYVPLEYTSLHRTNGNDTLPSISTSNIPLKLPAPFLPSKNTCTNENVNYLSYEERIELYDAMARLFVVAGPKERQRNFVKRIDGSYSKTYNFRNQYSAISAEQLLSSKQIPTFSWSIIGKLFGPIDADNGPVQLHDYLNDICRTLQSNVFENKDMKMFEKLSDKLNHLRRFLGSTKLFEIPNCVFMIVENPMNNRINVERYIIELLDLTYYDLKTLGQNESYEKFNTMNIWIHVKRDIMQLCDTFDRFEKSLQIFKSSFERNQWNIDL